MSETDLDDDEKRKISEIFYGLRKESLAEVIKCHADEAVLMQVTTFSRLLTEGGKSAICRQLDKSEGMVHLISLQQITTEQQFSKQINHFLDRCGSDERQILIVQGIVGPNTPNSLVECVRYSILHQVQERSHDKSRFCIILVLQVPRIFGGFFSGFPGLQWKAFHIDELCGDPNGLNFSDWNNRTLYNVLQSDEDQLDLVKVISEAVPRALSEAFRDVPSSPRIVDCAEILTWCVSRKNQVLIFLFFLYYFNPICCRQ